MKKTCFALATTFLALARAHAEDGVQLYGVLDEGLAHIDHSPSANNQFVFSLNSYNIPAQGQGGVTAMVSGGAAMSRWGIQGSEDLGSGVHAFFKLESALNLGSGQLANNGQSVLDNANGLTTTSGAAALNGQLFARGAYVGIGDRILGSLQLGRTTAFSFDQTGEFDPLHGSGLYSPIGFSGQIGGGLGITENTRLDNSLKYQNSWGDFRYGVQYKIGSTNNGDAADVGSVLEGLLGYRSGPLNIALTGSQAKNTPSLSFKLFTNDVGLRVSDTSGFMLTAKYDLSAAAQLTAGIQHTAQGAPSASNNWGAQITSYYGMSLAGLVTAKPFSSAWGNADVDVGWIGAGYYFSPQFNLDTGYYHINNQGNNHNDQYTIQAFSLMADYHFSKNTDVYAALMLTHYDGPYLTQQSPPELASSNAIFGAGVRVKF